MITEIIFTKRTTKCESMRCCLFCVTVRAVIILTKLFMTNVQKKTKSVFQDHQSILGLVVENLGNFSIRMNACNHYWDSTTCIICPTEQWNMILSINRDKYRISSVKTKKKHVNPNFAQDGWTEMFFRVFHSIMKNSEFYSLWRTEVWKHLTVMWT